MSNLLEQAFAQHQAGNLPDAEIAYRTLLKRDSQNARAAFLLGTLLCQKKAFDEAIQWLKASLHVKADQPEAYNSLGNAYLGLGQVLEAEKAYQVGTQIKGTSPTLWRNLALVYLKQHKSNAAIELLRVAVNQFPNEPALLSTLAGVLAQSGFAEEAQLMYEKLTLVLPQDSKAWLNAGNFYKSVGLFQKAEMAFRKSVSLDALNPEAANNLGVVLMAQGQFEEARGYFYAALRLQPKYAGAYGNLSQLEKQCGNIKEAIKSSDHALELDPMNAEMHVNRAFLRLGIGDYAGAWPDLSWRFRTNNYLKAYQDYPFPRWDGTEVKDQCLLVHGEQGLGDEIIFSSLLPELQAKVPNLILACHPKLTKIFERSFPAATVVPRSIRGLNAILPEQRFCSAHAPLMDLPRWLRPNAQAFKKPSPFLIADVDKILFWKERLKGLSGKKVGLVWRSEASDLHNPLRKLHAPELEEWASLLAAKGISYISLQHGSAREQVSQLSGLANTSILDFADLDTFDDLDSLAAVITNLDCVVGINTAAVYLAAALGVQSFVLMPYGMTYPAGKPEFCKWLPNLLYCPQPKLGDWAGGMKTVIEALAV